MAKLRRLGDAVVIKTNLTVKQIQTAEALAPSALEYRDPETKRVMFSITTNTHEAFSRKGIVFNAKGYVTVGTMVEMEDTGLEFGRELMYLNIIETQVEDVLKSDVIQNLEEDIEIIEV